MYVGARRGREANATSPRAGVRVVRVHESRPFLSFFPFFFFFSLVVARERGRLERPAIPTSSAVMRRGLFRGRFLTLSWQGQRAHL